MYVAPLNHNLSPYINPLVGGLRKNLGNWHMNYCAAEKIMSRRSRQTRKKEFTFKNSLFSCASCCCSVSSVSQHWFRLRSWPWALSPGETHWLRCHPFSRVKFLQHGSMLAERSLESHRGSPQSCHMFLFFKQKIHTIAFTFLHDNRHSRWLKIDYSWYIVQ